MKAKIYLALAAGATMMHAPAMAQQSTSAASTSTVQRSASGSLGTSREQGARPQIQREFSRSQGQNARTLAGVTGQRQTIYDAAVPINPLARLDTRVQNRVQSRIRNRIDRYYDPRANATAPFEVASDQLRGS